MFSASFLLFQDMTPRRNFADLLYYLNDNLPDGTISRIRYVTSHPRYFSDRVIDAVANLDKVCECFHMPFQAGDDKVLKEMRRGYTFDSYMTIIRKIKEKAPDASICGDVSEWKRCDSVMLLCPYLISPLVVGFPGETEEEVSWPSACRLGSPFLIYLHSTIPSSSKER